jgi:hypothetical protein
MFCMSGFRLNVATLPLSQSVFPPAARVLPGDWCIYSATQCLQIQTLRV